MESLAPVTYHAREFISLKRLVFFNCYLNFDERNFIQVPLYHNSLVLYSAGLIAAIMKFKYIFLMLIIFISVL